MTHSAAKTDKSVGESLKAFCIGDCMHSASIEKSPRLQRVLDVLSDRKKHTTRDIIRKASVCAVNSCISELRDNGLKIECERTGGLWRYWMVI